MSDYVSSLKSIAELVTQYGLIKRTASLDEIQNIRDEISENLFHFGETYAEIRGAAEKSKIDYDDCVNEQKLYWRKEGKAGEADSKAQLDCKELMNIWHEKKVDYYRAQALLERADQLLNSISSRISRLKF